MQDVCDTEVDAGVALLRAPIDELKNFKVIGVIHGVQLVVDTKTEGAYVVKVFLVFFCCIAQRFLESRRSRDCK
jgi:hypothetical protein